MIEDNNEWKATSTLNLITSVITSGQAYVVATDELIDAEALTAELRTRTDLAEAVQQYVNERVDAIMGVEAC